MLSDQCMKTLWIWARHTQTTMYVGKYIFQKFLVDSLVCEALFVVWEVWESSDNVNRVCCTIFAQEMSPLLGRDRLCAKLGAVRLNCNDSI